jgi:hypothetical protein
MNVGVPKVLETEPPKLLYDPVALPPGGEKFARLGRLKNSERN